MYRSPATPPAVPAPHTTVEREGRHILTLCMRLQLDQDPATGDLIERKIQRLIGIAFYKDDYAYFTHPPCSTALGRGEISPGEVSLTPGDTAPMKKVTRVAQNKRIIW